MLQYVGCFGEEHGLSWANVEDPQHSPKHQQGRPVVRVSCKCCHAPWTTVFLATQSGSIVSDFPSTICFTSSYTQGSDINWSINKKSLYLFSLLFFDGDESSDVSPSAGEGLALSQLREVVVADPEEVHSQ